MLWIKKVIDVQVPVQRALSREEWHASALSRNPRSGRLDGGGGEGGNVTNKSGGEGLRVEMLPTKLLLEGCPPP